jgi:hypothetical protein
MKKLLSFMLLFLAVMTASVLTSCGDDDNNDDKTTVAGTYTGTDSLHFGMGTASYKTAATNVQYVVTENSDNSINVTLSEETYDFSATVPFVGKIVQGSYTIKNIPYDATKKAYYLDYSNKASANVSISGMQLNKQYDVTLGQITVSFTGSTMTLVNVHKFGSMPMALTATFVGTK